ncbi:hypothetical protein [Spongiactinospora sp. TRM90649]|uniref:hypothetical protein n=1 Tax=Spongiactinospora sp. TRM90649 TaxID=3031114 RepID=UPI0023F74F02|nr:hypothetical protein [Spongiactinospora sp. TRM90649]MDF5759189.1 hypothetical protein [Spongiactinospora sp. TRM90649]
MSPEERRVAALVAFGQLETRSTDGEPGIWPGGESPGVRAAYDAGQAKGGAK